MNSKINMIYWKSEKFWLGKLLEHPEIMTQGESLEELEENIKDAYLLMAMDDVPDKYETKEIALWRERSLLSYLNVKAAISFDTDQGMISTSIQQTGRNSLFQGIQR